MATGDQAGDWAGIVDDNPDAYVWRSGRGEAARRWLEDAMERLKAEQWERDRPRRIEQGIAEMRAGFAPGKGMRIFEAEFPGVVVGGWAVVIADDEAEAMRLIVAKLESEGSTGYRRGAHPIGLVELPADRPGVHGFYNGDM
jgi:hypothetical protein